MHAWTTFRVAGNLSTQKAIHPLRKPHSISWTKTISLVFSVSIIWVWSPDEWSLRKQETYCDPWSDRLDFALSDLEKRHHGKFFWTCLEVWRAACWHTSTTLGCSLRVLSVRKSSAAVPETLLADLLPSWKTRLGLKQLHGTLWDTVWRPFSAVMNLLL